MKRRRIEQERREKKLQAEEMERAEQTRRLKRKQTIVMIASLAAGLLAAGTVRKLLGDAVPYWYGSSKARGWAGGTASDPLILFGLAGGGLAGAYLCRRMTAGVKKDKPVDRRRGFW